MSAQLSSCSGASQCSLPSSSVQWTLQAESWRGLPSPPGIKHTSGAWLLRGRFHTQRPTHPKTGWRPSDGLRRGCPEDLISLVLLLLCSTSLANSQPSQPACLPGRAWPAFHESETQRHRTASKSPAELPGWFLPLPDPLNSLVLLGFQRLSLICLSSPRFIWKIHNQFKP